MESVVTLLDEIGFAPTIDDSNAAETVIELHRCPFIEVARANTDVVCVAHLGLIQGAIAEIDAPAGTVRLEPFVRPDLCLVRLGQTAPTA